MEFKTVFWNLGGVLRENLGKSLIVVVLGEIGGLKRLSVNS